uniref:Uncharacterized protein n=1 Tax=Megaselia scalaris TaxID=36166 RepID=T1GPC5_MEGSC
MIVVVRLLLFVVGKSGSRLKNGVQSDSLSTKTCVAEDAKAMNCIIHCLDDEYVQGKNTDFGTEASEL